MIISKQGIYEVSEQTIIQPSGPQCIERKPSRQERYNFFMKLKYPNAQSLSIDFV